MIFIHYDEVQTGYIYWTSLSDPLLITALMNPLFIFVVRKHLIPPLNACVFPQKNIAAYRAMKTPPDC